MGLKLNMNAMNQIVKGVPIWEENETITSVCLVLKGRILVQREGMQTILGTGNFLGICDLYSGSSSVTYTAYDNAVIYPFSVRSPGDIETIIHKNKEYGGLMVASLSRYIRELRGIVEELSNEARDLCIFLQDYYERYQIQAKKVDFNVPELKELSVMEDYEMSELLDMRKAEYYSECAGVPIEVQKEFYQNETICVYHIEEQTELARQLILECTEIYQFLKATAKKLYDKGEYCLFKQVARCIITLNAKNKNPDKELIDSIDRMVEKLNTLDLLLEKKTGRTLDIDRDELENLYYMILSGEVPEEIATSVKEKVVMLHDSMDKIFQAGSFTGEKKEAFLQLFSQYKSMVDKNAVDDASRRLRKEL
ncbi:MAG: hypothetical protein PWP24_1742, partial [Clostridiales bacterium]|nr:hypothetical protein [Clostridiales bacterium]